MSNKKSLAPEVKAKQNAKFLNYAQRPVSSYEQYRSLKPGDHLCLLYENKTDWLESILPFLQAGLDSNHKCLYITHSSTIDELTGLFPGNFDITGYISGGRLLIMDSNETFSPDNRFDPEKALKLIENEAEKALNEGFNALSVTLDTGRALNVLPGSEKLAGFVSRLNSISSKRHPVIFVSQYDIGSFEPVTTMEILKVYPQVIWKADILDNCYYTPPGEIAGQDKSLHEFTCFLRHLEQEKSRKKQLAESEERYRALVELSGEVGEAIVMLVDTGEQEGVIAFANRQLERITGLCKKELLGRPFYSLLSAEHRRSGMDRYRRRLRGESLPGLYEVNLIRNDGTRVPCEITSALTRYNGRPANVVYLRDITERKKAEKELNEAYASIRKLAIRLEKAAEEERRRISYRLHDEVGQMLTALKMDVNWLSVKIPAEQQKLVNKTESMIKTIDAISQIIRGASAELRPRLIDELGLFEAISWHLREFEKATGISCICTSNSTQIPNDKEINIGIFRIFQELLTNVYRHAEATRVKVSLKEENGRLTLVVRDNGKGIPGDKISAPNSLGILGIKERVHYMNGKVAIRGYEGKGTRVSISVPMPEGTNKKC